MYDDVRCESEAPHAEFRGVEGKGEVARVSRDRAETRRTASGSRTDEAKRRAIELSPTVTSNVDALLNLDVSMFGILSAVERTNKPSAPRTKISP